MFCMKCGAQNQEDSKFCEKCGSPLQPASTTAKAVQAAPTPVASVAPAVAYAAPAKTLPDGVAGWSWGAFFLNWIWAIGNKTWWGLLALIPYVNVGVAIWLGLKGRELAWKNREWEDLAHFNRVQRKWSQWGIGVVVASAVIGIVAAVAIPAYEDHIRSKDEAPPGPLSEMPAAMATPAIAEKPSSLPAQNPAPAPAPVNVGSGVIDSNADGLPKALDTVAGRLTLVEMPSGERRITVNGTVLFNGEDAQYQFPVRSFKLSGEREAILMASSGGRGTSCETLFFFLIADRNGLKPTPEFGTCYYQGEYVQTGDKITITLPKMGGKSVSVFDGVTVTEDGKPLNLVADTDPSK